LLFYLSEVVQFGFAFSTFDLIGGYFLVCCCALAMLLKAARSQMAESGFLFAVCALAIPASALFLGWFLSTFDPFYRVSERPFVYLVRGLFLAASLTTLLALRPPRFFKIPRWLIVLTCLVTAGWLFVYACPSIVREWYGTRTAPSDLFPKGMLMLSRANPERGIQAQMLLASAAAWLATVIVGRILYRRAHGKTAKNERIRLANE
jgi:hypothetical protein